MSQTMNKKLYVGNLVYECTDQDLKDQFTAVGNVVSAVIIKFRDSGKSKGFGFVTFTNDEDAEKAIKGLDGKEIEGRNIKENIAKPREER